MVRSLITVILIAALFGLVSRLGMEVLNRKMGLDQPSIPASEELPNDIEEYTVPDMPDYQPAEMTETGSAVWNPDWKATACSLYTSGDSEAVLDTLPEAPGPLDRPTELQLLMELWASTSGYSQTDIERVWAFSSGDTCFIDLPSTPDWTGVVKTIEARFISYTVLFPFIAGEAVSGYEEGITLRGIPSSR